jgi:hypothetical protein
MKKKYTKYAGKKVIMTPDMRGYVLESDKDRTGLHLFTVYTKDPSCGPGDYAEEIDVLCKTRSATEARHVAQAAIDQDYVKDLWPSRVVYRLPGVLFA